MKRFVFMIFVMNSLSVSAINKNLVKEFMKFHNIRICLLLTCDHSTKIVDKVITHESWMNVWDLSNESKLDESNFHIFFRRLASPLTVVIDLACNQSLSVLTEISLKKMFHYERYWLMFYDNYEQAYQILQHQFINMDAEIYLALPVDDT